MLGLVLHVKVSQIITRNLFAKERALLGWEFF